MYASIRERRSEEGFTLIELLVVMIIIAILMAVAVPTFLAQKNNAQKTKATANIKQIVNAIESCSANNTDGGYQGCTTPLALTSFEKGLVSLATGGNTLVNAPSTAVGMYGIVPSAGTNPQGYAVSASIKDGDIPRVTFTEVHNESGALLKICGTAACPPTQTAYPTGGVSGSRTCTNGRWG